MLEGRSAGVEHAPMTPDDTMSAHDPASLAPAHATDPTCEQAPYRYERQYSPETVGAALAWYEASGGKLRETSRRFDVPIGTLHGWVNDRSASERSKTIHAERAARTEALDTIWERVAYEALGAIDGRYDEASPLQLATMAGIATDKLRLLRGEATSITLAGTVDLSADERRARLADMLGRMQAALLAAPAAQAPAIEGETWDADPDPDPLPPGEEDGE